MSYRFLIMNFCIPGVHEEMPCIYATTYVLSRNTNQLQPCNRIYYSKVY